jgi:membrane associated rhomboid family serine protease
LLANMFSLFFIGNFIERLIGRKRFFGLYIVAGIFAGLFYVFLSYYFGSSLIGAKLFGTPETYAVGASGAIFSLLGLLAVLTPYNSVYLIVGPLIALTLQGFISSIISSKGVLSILDLLLSVYILVSIFSVFSFNESIRRIALPVKMRFWVLPIVAIVPLILVGLFVDLPIGNSAHVGGLIAGLIFAFYLKRKYKNKTALISKYFSS